MKKYILLLITIYFALWFFGCSAPTVKGSGISVDEERIIDYVSEVQIEGNFNVDISCGETNSLNVEAEDNILPLLETKVVDEKLTIKSKKRITNLREVKITLTTHTITELSSEGRSSVTVKNLNSDELDVSMDGEGEIHLDGRVDELDISMYGEGKLLAKELQTKHTRIYLYGEGKAEVYARKSLKAKVKGAGIIDYWGDPEEISIEASKGGSVNKK